jgi:hypothetical protein
MIFFRFACVVRLQVVPKLGLITETGVAALEGTVFEQHVLHFVALELELFSAGADFTVERFYLQLNELPMTRILRGILSAS